MLCGILTVDFYRSEILHCFQNDRKQHNINVGSATVVVKDFIGTMSDILGGCHSEVQKISVLLALSPPLLTYCCMVL